MRICYALRGLGAFATAGLVPVMANVLAADTPSAREWPAVVVLLAAYAAAGALAGAVVAWPDFRKRRAAAAFAAGTLIAWAGALLFQPDTASAPPDQWQAAAWTAAAFAVGGAVGGLGLGSRYAVPGCVAFGFAGLIAGPLWSATTPFAQSRFLLFGGALAVAYAIAGALFGAFIDWTRRSIGDRCE